MKLKKQISFFLLFLVMLPVMRVCAETVSNAPEALKLLQRKIQDIKSFKDTFELLDEFMDFSPLLGNLYNDQASEKKVLQTSEPIIITSVSELCDEAIYDFRQSLKSEFVKNVGEADGKMSQSQFIALVNSGKFPIKKSAEMYFADHDKDRDNKLTISEFVPSPVEIAKTNDAKELSDAYINGEPYATGQLPTQDPPSQPRRPLYATPEMIENRVRIFARNNGYTAKKRPDGKLGVVDGNGNWITIPPKVFPPSRKIAEEILRNFAAQKNASVTRGVNGLLILKGPRGIVIPIALWPPASRPPYFPPNEP